MKHHWSSKRLKEFPIKFIDGDRSSRYPKRSEFVENGVLFLNAESISGGFLNIDVANFIAEEKFCSIKKGRLELGDVILTMRGNGVGKVGFFIGGPHRGLINAQMLIIRPDPKEIDPRFFYYLLRSPYYFARLRSMATGSAQPQLSITSLRELEVSLPPLVQQRKVSATLSAYDDLIENNRRRIKILEEMAQNLYREWFVKFRFPGHEQVRMVDSPLGKIPEGWEVAKIGDVTIVHRGRSYRSKDLLHEGGLPFINLKCIDRDGGFRRDGLKRYEGQYKLTHKVQPGDIVMAVTDMTQERRIVARAGRVPTLDSDFGVISMDLVKIEPRDGFSSDYLYGYFRGSDFADNLKQHANGANVLHLSPERINEYQFVLPSEDVREQFTAFSTMVLQQIENLNRRNLTLRQTRDLLLPKLISGELDVSELDIATDKEAA